MTKDDLYVIQSREAIVKEAWITRLTDMLNSWCEMIFLEPWKRDGTGRKWLNVTTWVEHTILEIEGKYQSIPSSRIINWDNLYKKKK